MAEINIIRTSLDSVSSHLSGFSSLYIIYDNNVKSLVDQLGLKPKGAMGIDATEENKTLQTIQKIEEWLMEAGAGRTSFVLGVGGGITTDISGFAASVFKRGVRFGFLPTTLLAQVDAAIGGKNGVNLDSYKNMVGAIRQPEMTIICPEVLRTLPLKQLASGAAELLKTFIIDNKGGHYVEAVDMFSEISNSLDTSAALFRLSPGIQNIIASAAEIKAGIAGRDPDELGERRLLNLGHTFAHAIEKKSGEKIAHGEAVGMGIILAARLSENLGVADEGLERRFRTDFRAVGLATDCPFVIDDLAEPIGKDKKAEGEIVHFVLPVKIGQVGICDLTVEEAIEHLK